jgi:hypothetical protein
VANCPLICGELPAQCWTIVVCALSNLPLTSNQKTCTMRLRRAADLRQYCDIGARLAPAIHQHQDRPFEFRIRTTWLTCSLRTMLEGQADALASDTKKRRGDVGAEH